MQQLHAIRERKFMNKKINYKEAQRSNQKPDNRKNRMKNKIAGTFAKGKAFIPFITCGDPSLEVTEKLVYAM